VLGPAAVRDPGAVAVRKMVMAVIDAATTNPTPTA
jgi:hypothetical protein